LPGTDPSTPSDVCPGFVPPITEADLDSAAKQILEEGEEIVPEGISVSGPDRHRAPRH
jgi:hypothetical protein